MKKEQSNTTQGVGRGVEILNDRTACMGIRNIMLFFFFVEIFRQFHLNGFQIERLTEPDGKKCSNPIADFV